MISENIIQLKDIEDMHLDPYEFRVYCRIKNKSIGKEFREPIKEISKACKISSKTVGRNLLKLIKLNMIIRKERPGDFPFEPDTYILTNLSEWKRKIV